jgi:hypothetical protein
VDRRGAGVHQGGERLADGLGRAAHHVGMVCQLTRDVGHGVEAVLRHSTAAAGCCSLCMTALNTSSSGMAVVAAWSKPRL